MNCKMIILLTSLIFVSASALAEDLVLCIPTGLTSVYSKDLKKILFKGRQFETVALFQGFGTNEIKTDKVTFVRAEFTDRDEDEADNNVGWIDKNFIKPKSKCAG